MSEIASLATFVFVASITPGPNNVLLISTTSRFGFRRGYAVWMGIAVGFSLMAATIALGVGKFLLSHQDLLLPLKLAGIAFLLWLALQLLITPMDSGASDIGSEPQKRPFSFFSACIFQWVNPKAWIVTTAAIAAYVRPNETLFEQVAKVALIFNFAALAGCFPWLVAGSLLKKMPLNRRSGRIFNIIMGGLLALTALQFAVLP